MSWADGRSYPPILSYHKIDTRFEMGFTQLEPRVFQRQVETLARLGYRSLGGAELERALVRSGDRAGAEVQGRRVVFTFDDGYDALARHAFPVLAHHGFRALVFVVTDYVGRDNTWDVQYGWRRFRHLGWDELARWQERGIEVHSHTATHPRLTWLSDDQVAQELARSREAIARRVGEAPLAVSYPFGSVDRRVRDLAAAAGYGLGFAGPGRGAADAAGGDAKAAARVDPLLLSRWPVYGWDRFALPLVLGRSRFSPVAHALARFTNRCAVGTALFQRVLGRRYRR
jgi:peptidoglycan/xylan/chitin deacetylase (PgdA/CDA1 family)